MPEWKLISESENQNSAVIWDGVDSGILYATPSFSLPFNSERWRKIYEGIVNPRRTYCVERSSIIPGLYIKKREVSFGFYFTLNEYDYQELLSVAIEANRTIK